MANLIHLDSGDRHSGELERSHPTNEPSQIQSAQAYVLYKLKPIIRILKSPPHGSQGSALM
jgi:hypothetical protein